MIVTLILCFIIIALIGVGLHNYRLLKQREVDLHKLAYFDTLTGLSNRLRFNEIAPAVINAAAHNKSRVSFFIIDVDGFKQINDTYGHSVGDKFLKELSNRLQEIIKIRAKVFGEDSCFASRLGGDEFVLLFNKITDAKESAAIADRLFKLMSTSIIVDNVVIEPSISVGISIYPYDGESVSALLKAADLALYSAKENGKDTYFFHEHSMNTKFERQLEYQSTIKYFIETGDFKMHYQPIVETKHGTVKGAEALFGGNRLKYPSLNIQDMMITAEETNDIVELGYMILERSCQDYMQYIYPVYKRKTFLFSVNVSANQLDDEEFVDRVKAIIAKTNMPPGQLGLEITETAIIMNYEKAVAKLEQLKQLGIKFSIDDFGKGYSSMSYLRRLSVHKVKIDRSFIEDSDKKSAEIVRTIVMMCKTLGLVCVVEGIETEDQYRFLKNIDCDQIQGYLVSRPITPTDFVHFPGYSLPTHQPKK